MNSNEIFIPFDSLSLSKWPQQAGIGANYLCLENYSEDHLARLHHHFDSMAQ